MKQSLIYLIILLLTLSTVSALSVELTSPQDKAYIYSSTVNFKCKATGSSLTQLVLYTNISGTWAQTASSSPVISDTEVNFNIQNINNGGYKWNCLILSQVSPYGAWAPLDRTFIIDYENYAPSFSGPIPNQTWDKDTSKLNVFDLDTYFSDPESGALTYSVSGSANINVQIDSSTHQVSFSQPVGWWGTEKVIFRACDPIPQCTNSNQVTLTISQTVCTESWACNSWSSCTNSTQTRTCTDSNNCGTTINKPAESQSCSTSCEEDWDCTDWSSCEDEIQTRSCTDNKDCGTTDDKPSESKSCSTTSSNDYSLEITSATPSSTTVTIKEGSSKVFTIDTNLIEVSIEWYLDDQLQPEASDTFRYTPAEGDVGSHALKVIVEKGIDKDAKEWDITVTQSTEISANPVCGNEKIESGEDCLTCPEDAVCKENEVCDEGICKEKENKLTGYVAKITDQIKDKWYYSLIILVLLILITLAVVFGKKKEKSPLAEFDEKKSIFGKIKNSLREWDRKRQQKKRNKSNIKVLQREKKEEITAIAPTGLNSIKNFINESRSIGYSERQIKKALLRKGWSRKQIKLAFKSLKK